MNWGRGKQKEKQMIDQLQEGKAKREKEDSGESSEQVREREGERACEEDMETTDVGKGWSK